MRQIPLWVTTVAGLWLVVAVVLVLRSLHKGAGQTIWVVVTLLWLLGGPAVVIGRTLIPVWLGPKPPPICGVDIFPDLVPDSFVVAKSDFVYLRVTNIGPCPMTEGAVGVIELAESEAQFKELRGKWVVPLGIPKLASGESWDFKFFDAFSYQAVLDGKFWHVWVNPWRFIMEEDYYNDSAVATH